VPSNGEGDQDQRGVGWAVLDFDRAVPGSLCLDTGMSAGSVSKFTAGTETPDIGWRGSMAQLIVSWFIDGGRFRVDAINATDGRRGRIIEVEELETGERFHGSARRLALACRRR
jgi:hypothetical protein